MKRTTLLIEDHAQMRENLSLILELNDYAATTAENGRIGVDRATASPPDVILCDVMMSEMDGYAVLAAVRADPDLNSIPFMFLTAKGEKQDLRAGMMPPANGQTVIRIGAAHKLCARSLHWRLIPSAAA